MSSDNGMREIGGYLRELEKVNRQLATENTQLRVSHSYRLGNAFVAFAKNRRIGGIPQLLRQIRQAMRPMQAHAPALPKRPDEFYDALGAAGSDLLRKRVEEPPVGTRIIRQATLQGTSADRLRVVGVIGTDLAAAWGAAVKEADLAYDRWDSDWRALEPTHLIIDTDELARQPGWRHVFTLRDPAATVETAAMLHKARRQGLVTVLIEPSQPHRFPLLSRARPLFDVVLDRDDVAIDRLASSEALTAPE